MAEDVTAGRGRKDEVGRSGIYPATGPYPDRDAEVITPGEINQDTHREGPGVQQNDELIGAERRPRLGNEEDKAVSESLGE